MTEKGTGSFYWSKSRALRKVRMIRDLLGKDRSHDPQSKVLQNNPDSGLKKASQNDLISDVNQDPQVDVTLKEAEEILHKRNPTS